MSIGRRTKIYWLCQILGWGTHTALNILISLVFVPSVPLQWKRYAVIFGCAAVLAVLTTHIFRFYIKRRGWLRLTPGRAFLRVIASSIVLGCIITAQVSFVWLLVFGVEPFKRLSWLPGALYEWTWTVFIR